MIAPLRRCLLLACLMGSLSSAQAAEKSWRDDLGRLFLTPQKRALLDELRKNNARIAPAADQPDSVRLDGIVRRSNGQQTIWLNGQAYSGNAPVMSSDERSARVITGDRKGLKLKVGQSAKISNASVATP